MNRIATLLLLSIALPMASIPALASQHQHDHSNPPPATNQKQEPMDHSQHAMGDAQQSPSARKPLMPLPEDRPVEATGPVLDLASLEATALQNSPVVMRAEADVAAAEGRARQAGLWPNPTAGYDGEEIRSGEPLRGGQHGFFVEQTIVLGGKLGKRRAVLLEEVKRARVALDAAQVRVRTQVRMAYFVVLAEQRRVEFLDRLRALVDEAIRTSDGLYNVGQADRPDVLEIEIEGRQAEIAVLQARSRLDTARRQLGIVVGDPSVVTGRVEGRLEDALPKVDVSALAAILERSPQMAAARVDVDRARANLRAQRAERIPDMFVRGGSQYNRELNELTGGAIGWQAKAEVGVDIPIFNRNQGGIAAAEAEILAAEADLKRLERDLSARFETVYTAYVNALRVSDVYRAEIIPKADESYRLYMARYQEMTAAYPQVLIARRTWIRVNLDYIETLEALYRAALPIEGFLLDGGLESPGDMVGPLNLPGAERGMSGGHE